MTENERRSRARERSRKLFELVLLTVFGVLMFATKIVMAVLPNVHLIGMFIMVFTISFRSKALIPTYIYVILEGFYFGFNVWWVAYLYAWPLLWAITMLLPRRMPRKVAMAVYPVVAAFHGLIFGALCAIPQAIAYNFSFEETLAWIAAGLSFDVTHAVGNFCFGLLVLPLSLVLEKLKKNSRLV